MKKSAKMGFAGLLAAGVAALGVSLTGVANAEQSSDVKAKIGEKAPDFSLKDMKTEKEHSLSKYTEKGKIVVLEWIAVDCPFVVKHYTDAEKSTINNLIKEFSDKDVVFLAINSANPNHPYSNRDRNLQMIEEWKIEHPMLVDSNGQVGRAYGARTTPHMYIIDTEGVLRYNGALDNDSSRRGIGDVNYVRQALKEILAGETVTTAETRPYGCSVKYAD